MPGAEADSCRKLWPNAVLVSTQNIRLVPKAVDDIIKGVKNEFLNKRKESKLGLEKDIHNFGTIQISEGCVGNCAYCITKLAKGELYSFQIKDIVKEFKSILAKGINKIYITSQDNGAYGLDRGRLEFVKLIKEILKINDKYKIRIGMMNPEHAIKIIDELVEIYKDKRVIKFIHIPVQSGSSKVLEDMGRKYKVKDFVGIVNKFRKEIPEICISTDIICGYPTETENDFEKSILLIKKTKPNVLNISKFASRPGTKASKLKQLSSETIKNRSRRMSELFRKHFSIS